jgi:hypothetical protein
MRTTRAIYAACLFWRNLALGIEIGCLYNGKNGLKKSL